MPYIHFTEEQKRCAASVDLVEFLCHQGEKLLPSGREKRLTSDHSITVRGNTWYDHAAECGGGPISFVQRFYGLSYPEAITRLLGGEQGLTYAPAEQVEKELKEFVLPPAASNMRRVFAYLVKTRGIERDVISAFARAGLLYEDDRYHNAVFVGKDEEGIVRHAHKRSTNTHGQSFRQTVEGSDFRYAFHWIGDSEKLYVFEAPIDMLSYITLNQGNWREHSYVACCGTSSIPVVKMIERISTVSNVMLCYDNDEAGNAATLRVKELVTQKGLTAERIKPERKDWNDELTERQEAKMCQTIGY